MFLNNLGQFLIVVWSAITLLHFSLFAAVLSRFELLRLSHPYSLNAEQLTELMDGGRNLILHLRPEIKITTLKG